MNKELRELAIKFKEEIIEFVLAQESEAKRNLKTETQPGDSKLTDS